MKLYRVHKYTDKEGSEGFQWFLSKSEANKEQKKWPEKEVETLQLFINKWDIVNFLNAYCDYSNNG